jgi:hypothetical protein
MWRQLRAFFAATMIHLQCLPIFILPERNDFPAKSSLPDF